MSIHCRFVRSYSTTFNWIRTNPEDIRVGHIIKYGYVKLPQIRDIFRSADPWGTLITLSKYNKHANKFFKIIAKSGSTFVAEEVDYKLQIIANTTHITLPDSSDDFIVCEVQISDNGDITEHLQNIYYEVLDE